MKHLDFINELAVRTLDAWRDRGRVLVLEEASSVIKRQTLTLLVQRTFSYICSLY
jgi:hypothetical protein